MADEPSEKKPESQPDQQGEKPAAAPQPESAAAKPAGDKPAAPAAKPAAPPPKKEEVKPLPLDNELVQRLRKKFGEAILEAVTDRKQAIITVATSQLAEIAQHCRDEERFNLLTDLTAVDWPRREKRFDIILNLYSFEKNERLRLKAHAAEGEKVPSVAGVFSTANWLERECYDMFGVAFDGHPDLRRILLPDEWQGFPLRKDYDILTQDTAWVKENLHIESAQ